jgi:hypothetical protein
MTHDFERWLLTKKSNLHELATHLGGYHQAKAYLRGVGVAWENESGCCTYPRRRRHMKKEYKRGYAAALQAGTKPADHNRTMQLFIERWG